ncbi:MAG TPA: hypothetical protein VFZ25_04210 [Chloroflexota bacterium]|nr:hypothetical protein [Chloroflexota bacterium]
MASPRIELKKLAGEWKGRGIMVAQGATFPIRARWQNELVAAGYGLRCEIRILGIPGAEEFVDVEQIGYDDLEQQFHMGTICTAGETHDLRGDWKNDVLKVRDDRMDFQVSVVSPDKLQVRVENAGGGPVFDLAFEK